MKAFQGFWSRHRDAIARILRYPTIISVVVFVVCGTYIRINNLANGSFGIGKALFEGFCLYGTLITPLLAFQSWSEVFHPNADGVSLHINTPIWGGVLEALSNIGVRMVLPVSMLMAVWSALSPKTLSYVIGAIWAVDLIYILIVYLPMLIAGFILHWTRPKTRRTPPNLQAEEVEVSAHLDEIGNIHVFIEVVDQEDAPD